MHGSLRVRRPQVAALAAVLVLSIVPGMAAAETVEVAEVCAGAEVASFRDRGTTHSQAIDCLSAYTDALGDPVIRGLDADTFGTSLPVRRDAFATLVFRFARLADPALAVLPSDGVTNPFDDVDRDSTHGRAILALAELGLLEGRDGSYRPEEELTRAQAAIVLHRLHLLLGVDLPDAAGESGFTDLGSGAADQIEVLAALGVIAGETPSRFGSLHPVLRGQTATLLARSAQVLFDQGLWPVLLGQPPAMITGTVRTSTVSGTAFREDDADTITLFRDNGFLELGVRTDAVVALDGVAATPQDLIGAISLGDVVTCSIDPTDDGSAAVGGSEVTCGAISLLPATIQGRLTGTLSVDGALTRIDIQVADQRFADVDVSPAALGVDTVTYTIDGVATSNEGPLAAALQRDPIGTEIRVALRKDGRDATWAFSRP